MKYVSIMAQIYGVWRNSLVWIAIKILCHLFKAFIENHLPNTYEWFSKGITYYHQRKLHCLHIETERKSEISESQFNAERARLGGFKLKFQPLCSRITGVEIVWWPRGAFVGQLRLRRRQSFLRSVRTLKHSPSWGRRRGRRGGRGRPRGRRRGPWHPRGR